MCSRYVTVSKWKKVLPKTWVNCSQLLQKRNVLPTVKNRIKVTSDRGRVRHFYLSIGARRKNGGKKGKEILASVLHSAECNQVKHQTSFVMTCDGGRSRPSPDLYIITVISRQGHDIYLLTKCLLYVVADTAGEGVEWTKWPVISKTVGVVLSSLEGHIS